MWPLTILSVLSLTLATGLCTPLPEPQVELERGSCPMFWFSFQGRCYKYMATHMSWAQAELYCLAKGANLASVHNVEEFNFIKSLIKNFDHAQYPTWIGLSDTHLEGRWMWTDGTKVDFTRWATDGPNGGKTSNCVETNYFTDWNDTECSRDYPSVCVLREVCPKEEADLI